MGFEAVCWGVEGMYLLGRNKFRTFLGLLHFFLRFCLLLHRYTVLDALLEFPASQGYSCKATLMPPPVFYSRRRLAQSPTLVANISRR